MIRQSRNGLTYFHFELFKDLDISYGIFTRHGGVSPQPWDSLNLGGTVGDSREHVIENRARIFNAIGRPVESIFDAWQVHGTHALRADAPRPLDQPHERADIILTDQPQVTLLGRFADCVPILLVDPVHRGLCIAHAGWQGTINQVSRHAVSAMQKEFGSRPIEILAGIGPSICRDCYQVGEDVAQALHAAGGKSKYLTPKDGRYQLDLWMMNKDQLISAGLDAAKVEIAGICTAENTHDWYSHRAEKGRTGRFCAVMAWGRHENHD